MRTNNNYWLGKKHTDITKQKMSMSAKKYHAANSKIKSKICLNCGIKYKTYSAGSFCSYSCFTSFRRKRQSENVKVGEHSCPYCGMLTTKKKYCSMSCANSDKHWSDESKQRVSTERKNKHFKMPIEAVLRSAEKRIKFKLTKEELIDLYCTQNKSAREIGLMFAVSSVPVLSALRKYDIEIRHINPMLGKHHSKETKQKISLVHKGVPKSEGMRAKISAIHKGKHVSDSAKKKISIAQKKIWENPEHAKKIIAGTGIRPNKSEKKLIKFLDFIYPNIFKYVGDGDTIIGHKNPDFININGKKQLIELFGAWWHEEDEVDKRIEYFKQYGFSTLIIWEKELKDLETLKPKIISFVEQK